MNSPLRRLTSCANRLEAEPVINFLRDHGIDVVIRSDDFGGLYSSLITGGAIHLYVYGEQYDDANLILKSDGPERIAGPRFR